MNKTLTLDLGTACIKVYGLMGGMVMPSTVASFSAAIINRNHRERSCKLTYPPMLIESDRGAYYVGKAAHDWGLPVQDVDWDWMTGSAELMSLFYGALTRYQAKGDVALRVALPVAALKEPRTRRQVTALLVGSHRWYWDGCERCVTVRSVYTTSRPLAAMLDYYLTDQGTLAFHRLLPPGGDIGIADVGADTVELTVMRGNSPTQSFAACKELGLRRLMELANHDGDHSLTDLGAQLRAGGLDLVQALPVWQNELLGYIESQWGRSEGRFKAVVVVGGGAELLREPLVRKFGIKTFIRHYPIIASARGMYKNALMRGRRKR